jgi:hypothetical protein
MVDRFRLHEPLLDYYTSSKAPRPTGGRFTILPTLQHQLSPIVMSPRNKEHCCSNIQQLHATSIRLGSGV